jgi:hypothetical protein
LNKTVLAVVGVAALAIALSPVANAEAVPIHDNGSTDVSIRGQACNGEYVYFTGTTRWSTGFNLTPTDRGTSRYHVVTVLNGTGETTGDNYHVQGLQTAVKIEDPYDELTMIFNYATRSIVTSEGGQTFRATLRERVIRNAAGEIVVIAAEFEADGCD